MRSKAFNTILFLLAATAVHAQYRIWGTVRTLGDSSAIRGCVVYLNSDDRSSTTDGQGWFLFEDVPNGNYNLHFTSSEFDYKKVAVAVDNGNEQVHVLMTSREKILDEVTIRDIPSEFGFTRMRAVENMGIYEAKKSEVIIPEQLVANLATNNARQIYSRVAGLNIWENDGAGLQLSVGGRGLDPNRSANFNVRQNGYDISADALGYPESYYTPPIEGVGQIQIVRGAAALQYGTQFGGLINFNMKKPVSNRLLELTARQSVGSFGFVNSFVSASGTAKKVSYYSFAQYKRGDGWRENAGFDNHTIYANVNYAFSEKTKVGVDVTRMGYLSQQPGGLTDEMFRDNPRQSNRERNWFKVDWNLFAIHVDHKFNPSSEFNLRLFGLSAYRYAVGFRPNRVATIDDNSERDLIKGDFTNWGAEARYLKRYTLAKMPSVVLFGSRYYHGLNQSTQGVGSDGSGADFKYVSGDEYITYDYRFPNRNVALFVENVLYVNDRLSLTQGLRYEYLHTTASGYYGTIYKDLAGNIIDITRTDEERTNGRHFFLGGLGVSFRPWEHVDVYTNFSQNYRSITFSDMRISNPSLVIDPDMKDEHGYSFDAGIRSEQTTRFNYDVSVFFLNYNNRIGEVQFYDENNRVLRRRGNIGRAIIRGVEAYGEIDLLGYCYPYQKTWSGVVFHNIAFIDSEYASSEATGIVGNKVEFVPDMNLKTGIRVGYRNLKASFQYTYVSDQFTDATNAPESDVSAVIGTIPSYAILDVSLSFRYRKFSIETTLNNMADRMYFTRRATGYPGPGILPSDGRSFYVTLQVKL